MKNYYIEYEKFCKKHGEYREHSFMENGITYKTVAFEDNASWYERYGKHVEKTLVEVKGVKVEVEVELFKIEYWSTDNGTSKFAYERY